MAYDNIPHTNEDCNSFFGMSFPEAKKAGKLPFNQLPVLEVGGSGGMLLAQSGSINRYLASLVDKPGFLPGTDPVQLAYCDMIHEAAQELARVNPIANIFHGDNFEKEKTDL